MEGEFYEGKQESVLFLDEEVPVISAHGSMEEKVEGNPVISTVAAHPGTEPTTKIKDW